MMEDHLNYLSFITSMNGEQDVRIKQASERMPAVTISCRRQLTIYAKVKELPSTL